MHLFVPKIFFDIVRYTSKKASLCYSHRETKCYKNLLIFKLRTKAKIATNSPIIAMMAILSLGLAISIFFKISSIKESPFLQVNNAG